MPPPQGKADRKSPGRNMNNAPELDTEAIAAKLSYYLMTAGHSTTGVTNIVLSYAKNLTQSSLGYVSVIDPVTRHNLCHTLTGMIGDSCRIDPGLKGIVFPVGEDGKYPTLWGHSLNTRQGFYTNQPSTHPASVGTPAHHVSIENFLSVPAMVRDELCGQISVANAPDGYNDSHLRAIERVAEVFAFALHRFRLEEGAEGRRPGGESGDDLVSGKEISELLSTLAENREKIRAELESNLADNLGQLVLPHLEKLRQTGLSPEQESHVNAVLKNLTEVTSPFIRKSKLLKMSFTPQELQVAVLIKAGLQTKDVADQLGLSVNAVNFHRKNIRKKLAINNKQVNLQTYLLSVEEW